MSKELLQQLEQVDSLLENAKYNEAIQELDRLLRIHGSDYRICYYLGDAYLCKKQLKDAQKYLTQAYNLSIKTKGATEASVEILLKLATVYK